MADGYKIYDQAQIVLDKINPVEGDVIVISFPNDIEPAQRQAFAESMQPIIPDDVTILCTREGVTVENFPESQMNKLGWYKFDKSKVN